MRFAKSMQIHAMAPVTITKCTTIDHMVAITLVVTETRQQLLKTHWMEL